MKAEVEAYISDGMFIAEVKREDGKEPNLSEILSGLRTLLIEICREYGVSPKQYEDIVKSSITVKNELN